GQRLVVGDQSGQGHDSFLLGLRSVKIIGARWEGRKRTAACHGASGGREGTRCPRRGSAGVLRTPPRQRGTRGASPVCALARGDPCPLSPQGGCQRREQAKSR